MTNGAEKPEYGNWVTSQSIIMLLTFTAIFAVAAAIAYFGAWYVSFLMGVGIILTVLMLLFLSVSLYYLAARYVLSYDGGNVQEQLLDLILSHIPKKTYKNILDIGCGSGALAIKLAEKFPHAQVTGLDSWRAGREYTMEQCRQNACLAHVNGSTDFINGSAVNLPFEGGSFDLVVSNLSFHEVRDARDKWDAVREALRVLKPEGVFVFQDKFLLRSLYGEKESLQDKVYFFGVRKAQFIDTSREEFIPRLLKIPFALGRIAIICGIK
jgi:ubiquinone/menaquinone biosynthesis C-methylase UbiE